MKALTREQVERRKEKAGARHDVMQDPDRADEIASEASKIMPREKRSLDKSKEKNKMARPTKTREELQDEIDDLKAENQGLQDQLDSIADIVAPTDEDEDEDDDQD